MRRPAAPAALAALLATATAAYTSTHDAPALLWAIGGPDPASRPPAGMVNLALIHHTPGRADPTRQGVTGGPPQAGPGRTGNVPLGELEGLTPAQLAAAESEVSFRIRREAGTFACEGTLRAGRGSGRCGFTADEGFAAELDRRGVGRPTAAQQVALAMNEVGLGHVEALAAARGATPGVADLVLVAEHGVELEYLRAVAATGFRGPVRDVVKLADREVEAGLVRAMRELGYDAITADELVSLKSQGVTPDFVRQVNQAAGSRQPVPYLLRRAQRGR
jgi:hypothetical protein